MYVTHCAVTSIFRSVPATVELIPTNVRWMRRRVNAKNDCVLSTKGNVRRSQHQVLYAGVVLAKNIGDIDPRNRGVEGAQWPAPKVGKFRRRKSRVEWSEAYRGMSPPQPTIGLLCTMSTPNVGGYALWRIFEATERSLLHIYANIT